jgi:methyl-accepting chemotaxis protein
MPERSLDTFRWHLVLASATATIAFAAVIAVSMFAPLASQLDRPDLSPQVAGGIAEYFLYLHAAFWPVVLCSLASSVVTALLLFREMVQPLVRFMRVFQALERGEVPAPVTIRARDYLRDEARALNGMLVSLAARRAQRELAAQRVAEIADDLSSMAGASDPHVRDLLTELTGAAKQIG